VAAETALSPYRDAATLVVEATHAPLGRRSWWRRWRASWQATLHWRLETSLLDSGLRVVITRPRGLHDTGMIVEWADLAASLVALRAHGDGDPLVLRLSRDRTLAVEPCFAHRVREAAIAAAVAWARAGGGRG
jgi:hypothetical protein